MFNTGWPSDFEDTKTLNLSRYPHHIHNDLCMIIKLIRPFIHMFNLLQIHVVNICLFQQKQLSNPYLSPIPLANPPASGPSMEELRVDGEGEGPDTDRPITGMQT